MSISKRTNESLEPVVSPAQLNDKQLYYFQLQSDPVKREKAFKLAIELRNFEIELYWKRTAYFWAFVLIAFGGFITVISIESYAFDNELWLLAVSCFGIVMSSAWVLVNRGSKYWQENWENHIDQLEDDIVGPLYKTILERPRNLANFINPLAPFKFSVSRVNQIVSVFVWFIWLSLFVYSSIEAEIFSLSFQVHFEHVFFIATIVAVFLLALCGYSFSDDHTPRIRPRKSVLSGHKQGALDCDAKKTGSK